LTNLLFLYLAYRDIKSCRKYSHDSVFAVAYFGDFLVGIGSFMFHTTLKYTPTYPVIDDQKQLTLPPKTLCSSSTSST
jgi:hypothetical protein